MGMDGVIEYGVVHVGVSVSEDCDLNGYWGIGEQGEGSQSRMSRISALKHFTFHILRPSKY